MATPSKTGDATFLAWQDIASAGQAIATALDVSTKLGAFLLLQLGRGTGAAFTAGWPNFRVEGSPNASGTYGWVPLATFQPAVGASIANTTLNGAVLAGATSFVVAAATNIAVGDVLFLGHTTDATKYELVRVKAVSGTTITPEEAVTYAHDTGALVTDQAEVYACEIDLSGIKRLRVVADNAGSGQAIKAAVTYSTWDSIG